jgi:hypothetical protein
MNQPDILAQLEEYHTEFSVKNIKTVYKLVEDYITDYSKGNGEQFLPVEHIESILDNAKLLLALPKQFDIRTEKAAFRKQYAKHVSQMCKFIRISYKSFNKAEAEKAESEEE